MSPHVFWPQSDPLPQRIHDEEPHPLTCACTECAERKQAINDTFAPWHQRPECIARLLRWLVLMERPPANIPDFIEHAETWQGDYEDLLMWSEPEAAA